MKKILLFLIPIIFISCVSTGGIEDYYESNYKDGELSPECYLQEGEEPQVYYSSNIMNDINFMKSNGYQILGYSSFNGPAQGKDLTEHVKNVCLLKKAKVGLYNYDYTDTRYGWTKYGSYSIQRYDYTVVLFVTLPVSYMQNQRTGFEVIDLTQDSRMALQRNTGAVIDVVYNKSNAYFANVIRNDVLIEINGFPIGCAEDYYYYVKNNYATSFSLKVIRNGRELTINY